MSVMIIWKGEETLFSYGRQQSVKNYTVLLQSGICGCEIEILITVYGLVLMI